MPKNARTYWFILLFVLLIGGGTAVAHAQDIITPMPPPRPPLAPDAVRIAYQRVDVTVEEQVATTRIDQLFVNENDWPAEGQYLFPLPEGAAVSELTMWVDGVPIEAKILDSDEARQIYDQIVRQMRDPALLEYVGSSAIQANVFPIPPGDERRIEIEYTQVLPAENGLIHYRYPQSTDLYTNRPLEEQSIRVEIRSNEEIRTVYSPSHPVAINRQGDFSATAGYEAGPVTPEQDFELYYSVSPETIGLNLLSYKETGEDGFFLLLAAPSVTVEEVAAKDVILVVDTSGSMEGEKLAQAKGAATYVVDHLNPEDRFNVVSFSTGVRAFEPDLVAAEDAPRARNFIARLEALGGTNISQALLEAMAMADAERPTTLIFLTDGLPTEGITQRGMLLDAVERAAPHNVRLFAFGVGNDVDPTLLDLLAQNHRGTTSYVRPFETIDEEVSGFYAKVSQPVLADLDLEVDGVTVEQIYPAELPDLFAGSQLVLTGRYRQGGAATVTLSGEVNGRTQTFTYDDLTFHSSGGDDFIPRLWATRAIGHFLTQVRLYGENPEMVQSIVNLSVRYGIITPYTSYLIEEDDIFSQTRREEIAAEEVTESRSGETITVEGESVEVTRVVEEMIVESETASDMAAAEAPLAAPTPAPTPTANGEGTTIAAADPQVQFAGAKTFVQRNGVWIDTAYDADRHTPQPIPFASDAYFDLLAEAPELGEALALGERVLVIYQDTAYQIVGEGETAVSPPEVLSVEEATPVTEEGNRNVVVRQVTPPASDSEAATTTEQTTEQSFGAEIGVGVALLLLVLAVLAWRLVAREGS